ncbi:MAG: hypothetical protein AVDCRST_MAG54-2651, partial [uncultured Actinomycetospora sp.]
GTSRPTVPGHGQGRAPSLTRQGQHRAAPERGSARAGLRRPGPGHEAPAQPRRDGAGRTQGLGARRGSPSRLPRRHQEEAQPADDGYRQPAAGRYLDQHTGGRRTVKGYREYVDKHVGPFIGKSKVGSIDAEILDSLYAV